MPNAGMISVLCGLSVALCGCAAKQPASAQSDPQANSRNMHSPNIYSDAYVQQQWNASIEALDAQCEATGQYCEEATKARESLRRNTK